MPPKIPNIFKVANHYGELQTRGIALALPALKPNVEKFWRVLNQGALMKMVEAIVKPFKLEEVKEALTKAGV